ncbi:biotin attachment protein (plasmid) [Fulvitalea axinellae]|uniref:Biotin attachment protein n=1 Tax=Fulvitalea axinellae TaxID=1182444 RepID=A0AAU9D9G7_9BACT|nr:biotin attachment protein [Fulvitalea axinellae]
MLNISPKSIESRVRTEDFASFRALAGKESKYGLVRFFTIFFLLMFGAMFLPWTQNIDSRGTLTALRASQRPQTVHSIIGGKIEKWYVQEGDTVQRGDTILFISETKEAYFDPMLVKRSQEQIDSKENAVKAYMEKINALDNQIAAMVAGNKLKLSQAGNKLEQARYKLATDSAKYENTLLNLKISDDQLKRYEGLYEEGLKSLTDLEKRRLTSRKALTALREAENKLNVSLNELKNAEVELDAIDAKFRDELAKAESNKFTAMSSLFEAEGALTKLRTQYTNYLVRSGLYYVTAPQPGIVNKAIRTGVGETIKAGSSIVSITPTHYDLAVEMYVKPMDMPLVRLGEKVRIRFDGWPAIVFSGWPGASYGTFGGRIVTIDNLISENGLYRVLVSPDPDDTPWPKALRIGAGTDNLLLLNTVSVWYELWRHANGFPADYYKSEPKKEEKKKGKE